MQQIIIIGAGTSGLIMAEVLAANGIDYRIIEKQKEAEFKFTEHTCYLHSDNIQKILPIPLKKVKVSKYFFDGSRFRDLQFSDLCTYTGKNGMITNSSIEECGKDQCGWVCDYGLNIHKVLFERQKHKIKFDSILYQTGKNNITVNTTPLFNVIKLVEPKDVHTLLKGKATKFDLYEFKLVNFDNIVIIHSIDGFDRMTIIGNKVCIENLSWSIESVMETFMGSVNIPYAKEMMLCDDLQKHISTVTIQKIDKLEEVVRKNIMFRLTSEQGIYSLGRYATWSYKRIDHVVDDALDIVKMIRFSQLGRW